MYIFVYTNIYIYTCTLVYAARLLADNFCPLGDTICVDDVDRVTYKYVLAKRALEIRESRKKELEERSLAINRERLARKGNCIKGLCYYCGLRGRHSLTCEYADVMYY